jgi:hypothetical protein
MDSVYYHLIQKCNEATRLAIAVVKNADYKDCIKEATDPIIIDTINQVQLLIMTLTDVLKRQEFANDKFKTK